MGLFDKIRGQFIDVIEWVDPSRDTIVWKFPRADNEIKNGAQLVCASLGRRVRARGPAGRRVRLAGWR